METVSLIKDGENSGLKKGIFILILLAVAVMFLSSSVNSATVDVDKSYDPAMQKITVLNKTTNATIADITLITPIIFNVFDRGEGIFQKVAELELDNYIKSSNLTNIQFYNKKDSDKEISRVFMYKYLAIVDTKKEPTYEQFCNTIFEPVNKTNIEHCTWNQTGSETVNVTEWVQFKELSQLPSGKVKISIWTDVENGDNVEWIPRNWFGVDIPEFAVWTADMNIGLQLYYNMNGTNESVVGEFNFSIIDSPVFTTNGALIGQSANLTNGFFNLTANEGTRMLNGSSSMNFWVNTINASLSGQTFYWGKDEFGSNNTLFGTDRTSYNLVGMMNGLDDPSTDRVGNQTSDQGVWTMLTFVSNLTQNYFYVNGTLIANGTSQLDSHFAAMRFGAGRNYNNPMQGMYDELGFWNRSLTTQEVSDLYNDGLGITFDANAGAGDTEVPTLVSILFPENVTYNAAQLPLFFNITTVENATAQYSLDGGINNVTMDGNESVPSGGHGTKFTDTNNSIADGSYTFTAYVNDTAGNLNNTASITFSVDQTPPLGTIIDPQNVTFTALTLPIIFNISTNENGTAQYSLDGGINNNSMQANNSFTLFNASNGSIADGPYTVTFFLNDTVGNKNSTIQRTFSVDQTPPDVIISFPTNTTFNAADLPFLFNVNLTENGSVQYSLDGGINNVTMTGNESTLFGTAFTDTNNSIADGSYTFIAFANDTLGNRNFTTTVTFALDQTFPGVTIITPTNTTFASADLPVVFNITSTENSTAFFTLDGGVNNVTMNANASGTGFDFTNNSIADGSFVARFYVNDTAGNTNSTLNVTFSVDQTSPGVIISFPTNTTFAAADLPLLFSVNLTENGSASYTLNDGVTNFSMQGNESILFGTSFNASNGSIADGSFTFRVFANDTFGNKNFTTEITFSVDQTAPIVTINFPANITYNITTFDFNVSLDTNGSVSYSLNGGTNNFSMQGNESVLFGTMFNATNNSIADGQYTFSVFANDTLGNRNFTTSILFGIDATIPQISFGVVTLANNSFAQDNSIFINVSVTEINEDTIIFTLYNSTGLVNQTIRRDGTRFINITGLPDEVYLYNVTINDTVGNHNFTATRTLTLDTTLPVITINSPADGLVSNVFDINLNITVTETNLDTRLYSIDGAANVSFDGDVFVNFQPATFAIQFCANDSAGNSNCTTSISITTAQSDPTTGGSSSSTKPSPPFTDLILATTFDEVPLIDTLVVVFDADWLVNTNNFVTVQVFDINGSTVDADIIIIEIEGVEVTKGFTRRINTGSYQRSFAPLEASEEAQISVSIEQAGKILTSLETVRITEGTALQQFARGSRNIFAQGLTRAALVFGNFGTAIFIGLALMVLAVIFIMMLMLVSYLTSLGKK